MRRLLIAFGVLALIGAPALAQNPYGPIDDLKLAKAEDAKDQPSAPAPAGAIVLFDGKTLDGWTKQGGKAAGFKLVDGGASINRT